MLSERKSLLSITGGILAACSLLACSPRKIDSEPLPPPKPFVVDAFTGHLTVSSGGVEYSLTYFGTDPKFASRDVAGNLNVVILPLPGYSLLHEGRLHTQYDYKELPSGQFAQTAAEVLRAQYQAGNFIMLALPGGYGAPGRAAIQDEDLSIDLANRAIDQLMEIYDSRQLNIAAHSATAPTAVGVLGRRTDVICAALSSGAFDMPGLMRAHGWPTTQAGSPRPYAAVDMVSSIPLSENRSITILVDPRDKIVPAEQSYRMSELLQMAGHRVELQVLTAQDENHHALMMNAIHSMMKCSTMPAGHDVK